MANLMAGPPRKLPPHLPAVLMLGIVSQVGQVLLLRELLMVFHGNELSIGLVLAAWLFWVGIGSRFGAGLVERTGRPLSLLAVSAGVLMAVLPATIFFIRGLRGFFDIAPGAYLSILDMIISCFLLMAPVCLLLGAQFVLLSRVWRESEQAVDTVGAGKTYVGEAAGNMLGGLLFTFLMVRYLNSFQSALLVGLVMVASVAFITWKIGHRPAAPGYTRPALLGLMVLAVAAVPFLEELDRWAHRIQWHFFSPQHELVETYQSRYGNIAAVRLEDQYTFFQSGHLVFSTAGPEAVAPGLEEQEAVEFAHFAMVQHEKPENVLLIGGGLRGVLGEIIKHPVERVDYVELDEVLTEAARPYISPRTLEALDDPRVRLIHTDGRLFVKDAEKKYDLIIIDAPDPTTAVFNRYYTKEFFGEAEEMLKPEGVLMLGTVSTPDLRGTAIANRNTTIYHTLNSVFNRVLPAGDRFMFYFASNEPEQITLDAHALEERFIKRDIVAEAFSARHFHVMLEETQLRRVNRVVRSHGRSSEAHLEGPAVEPLVTPSIAEQEQKEKELPPVEERYFINSDFKPIGYYYTLMFWDQLTRNGRGRTFERLLQVESWWILPFCFIPLLMVLGLRIAPGRVKERTDTSFAVLFTVFTTGFSTMALQIALLFSFQSIYGFIYEMVGLIIAMFMCGLSLGAYFTNRFVKDKANLNRLAAVQLAIAILAGLIAVILPRAAAVQYPAVIFILFSLLTFSAGLINGVDFPLSAACYMALGGGAEKTAGTVYGVELFGACLGAVLASAVVAPVLGITVCCLFAAVANGTAFVVLLLSRRS